MVKKIPQHNFSAENKVSIKLIYVQNVKLSSYMVDENTAGWNVLLLYIIVV